MAPSAGVCILLPPDFIFGVRFVGKADVPSRLKADVQAGSQFYLPFPKVEGVVYSRRIHTYEVAPSAGVLMVFHFSFFIFVGKPAVIFKNASRSAGRCSREARTFLRSGGVSG